MPDCDFPLQLISLNAAHFAICAVMPIYNKQFFRIAPYPIFDTFLQVAIATPISFLIAWRNHAFRMSLDWFSVPKEIVPHLIYSSLCYGSMMAFGNLGLYVSNIDYAIMIRFSGMVWQGIFAFLFLGEEVSFKSFISIISVMFGVVVLTTKPQKSSSSTSSFGQFAFQMITNIFTSLSSISMKKVTNQIQSSEAPANIMVIHTWRFIIAAIPMLIISLACEQSAWINIERIFSTSFIWFTLLGVAMTELFQLIGLKLTTMTTVITFAIISQLKFIPTLIISHILYKETTWTPTQLMGGALVCAGTVAYSLTRMKERDHNNSEKKLISEEEEEEDI